MNDQSLSRRAFLLAAPSAAVLAALAACGPSATTPSQLASSSATPSGGATASPASSPASTAPSTATAATSTSSPTAPTAGTGVASPATTGSIAGGQTILLNGAGSTFDYPLFSKVFAEFSKVYPNVSVNYQSVGSGAGIQQLTKGTVDFGASDAPMSDQQIQDAGGDVLHVPITLGAVAVAYNLDGISAGLKLTGSLLADMYLGKVTTWNDPAIVNLNPGAKLSNLPIAIVHRSDGSGTTDIFTTYLSTVSSDWKSAVGSGTAVSWPVGIGGKGSEGVSGQVKQTPGGLGYFELAYAKQNSLTSAAIDDGAGQFLLPSSDGASACAAGSAGTLPTDLRVRIAGCTGANVYPISGFSWVVLHKNQKDKGKGEALTDLLWWLVHQGQSFAPALYYAPLPNAVVARDEERLRGVSYQGQPLLSIGR